MTILKKEKKNSVSIEMPHNMSIHIDDKDKGKKRDVTMEIEYGKGKIATITMRPEHLLALRDMMNAASKEITGAKKPEYLSMYR